MRVVYLDTETTDREPGQICQIAYIVEESGQIIKRVNQYFSVKSISDGASKVTGLTKVLVDGLSGGMIFSDRSSEIYNDIKDAIVIGHNISFDEKFVSEELLRCGTVMMFKNKLCTMKYLTDIMRIPGRYGKYKWPNLGEALEYFKLTTADVEKFTQGLYGNWKMDAHDARYDTVAVYLIIKRLERDGVLNLEDYISVKI